MTRDKYYALNEKGNVILHGTLYQIAVETGSKYGQVSWASYEGRPLRGHITIMREKEYIKLSDDQIRSKCRSMDSRWYCLYTGKIARRSKECRKPVRLNTISKFYK